MKVPQGKAHKKQEISIRKRMKNTAEETAHNTFRRKI